ncbi:hypothetical protein NIES4074_02360 [Cylindrospermum sp. NIES-4074]|nr:hypothetical protein NIES4074_02360 [Cylindrospermum sp. NIES-4074]
MATRTTEVTDLVLDSKDNCYVLDEQQIKSIQDNIGVRKTLEPGIHVIRIRQGSFDYVKGDSQTGEPLVILWLYGGKFKNLKTNQEVPATWSTLNGYDDTLTLAVSETSELRAFFFDTYKEDNEGKATISVVKVGEVNDLS